MARRAQHQCTKINYHGGARNEAAMRYLTGRPCPLQRPHSFANVTPARPPAYRRPNAEEEILSKWPIFTRTQPKFGRKQPEYG